MLNNSWNFLNFKSKSLKGFIHLAGQSSILFWAFVYYSIFFVFFLTQRPNNDFKTLPLTAVTQVGGWVVPSEGRCVPWSQSYIFWVLRLLSRSSALFGVTIAVPCRGCHSGEWQRVSIGDTRCSLLAMLEVCSWG